MNKPTYIDGLHEPSRSEPHAGQVEMALPGGFKFMADKEMVPLIAALNSAGLQTYSHCAGHGPQGSAWVVLELASDVSVEIRPERDMGNGVKRGPQILIRWDPTWLKEVTP